MLAAAARATASNILRLVGDRTEAVLVQRGDHALWDALAARLARAGHDVRRVEKPDDDQRWDLTEHVPAGDRGYLVYHDPFRGDGEVPAGLDALRHAEPAPTVVVAFPHDVSAETLAAVSGHFLRALAEPWYATEFRARSLRSLIGAHGSVRVDGPGVAVRATVENVRTDYVSAERDHPILQLPLGECWLNIAPGSARGDLAGCDAGVRVDELAEVGIGVNPASLALATTTLGEKSLGRLHLGFGDNAMIGGTARRDTHVDVVCAGGTGATLEGAPGGDPVRLGEPAQVRIRVGGRWQRSALLGPQGRGTTAGDARVGVVGTASPAAVHNLHALPYLGDPVRADLFHLPPAERGAPRLVLLRSTGGGEAGAPVDARVVAAWDALIALLGPVPWPDVEVRVVDGLDSLAISLPGMILVHPDLCDQPLRLSWLYLVHELAHQWLGGLTVIRADAAVVESLVDVLALRIVTGVLGEAAAAPVLATHRRGLGSGPPDVRDRSATVLAQWERDRGLGVTRWARAEVDAGHTALERTGRRHALDIGDRERWA